MGKRTCKYGYREFLVQQNHSWNKVISLKQDVHMWLQLLPYMFGNSQHRVTKSQLCNQHRGKLGIQRMVLQDGFYSASVRFMIESVQVRNAHPWDSAINKERKLLAVHRLSLIPWMFTVDHVNCARWLSVHIRNMTTLQTYHPRVYEKFTSGAGFAGQHMYYLQLLWTMLTGDGDCGTIGPPENPSALRR